MTQVILFVFQSKNADDPNYDRAHEYLMKNTCDLRVEFVKRQMEVKSKRIWDDEEVNDVKEREDSPTMDDDDDERGFVEDYITPGGVIRLPITKHTKSIRAMYVRQKNEEKSSYVRSMQKKLCRVLSLCDQVSTVNIDIAETKALYGYSYIELKINEDARALLNATSIDFELQIEIANKQLVVKRFSLNCPPKRQKRSRQYTSYSSWAYTSIGHEGYFPDYQEHNDPRWCAVGSGSVAWAMIFGYYDRRSHYKTSVYGNGSQSLYACSFNGVYGSSACVAPQNATSIRIKKYIEVINALLGTCIFEKGTTPSSRMTRVKGFFRYSQRSGHPTVSRVNKYWKLIFRRRLESKTREWLRAGWPVVVGTKEGGAFKRHFPVATMYRQRWRKWRRSWWWFGRRYGPWQVDTTYQMYTHQGWGYGSVKWRDMRVHYAAIASY